MVPEVFSYCLAVADYPWRCTRPGWNLQPKKDVEKLGVETKSRETVWHDTLWRFLLVQEELSTKIVGSKISMGTSQVVKMRWVIKFTRNFWDHFACFTYCMFSLKVAMAFAWWCLFAVPGLKTWSTSLRSKFSMETKPCSHQCFPTSSTKLGGGLKYCSCSSPPAEMVQFD